MKIARRDADKADELIAGIDYPKLRVNGRAAGKHAEASRLLADRLEFWIAVATGHLEMFKAGCVESAADAREALAQADYYLPYS